MEEQKAAKGNDVKNWRMAKLVIQEDALGATTSKSTPLRSTHTKYLDVFTSSYKNFGHAVHIANHHCKFWCPANKPRNAVNWHKLLSNSVK